MNEEKESVTQQESIQNSSAETFCAGEDPAAEALEEADASQNFEDNPLVAEEAPKKCLRCGAVLMTEQKFCPNCGASVEDMLIPKASICKNCGIEIPAENKFCPNCGKPVSTIKELPEVRKTSGKKLKIILGVSIALVLIIAVIACLSIVFRKIPVESIVLSDYKIELKEEERKSVSCTVYPGNASDKTVVWTSSDQFVATVNEYGMVTAVGKGVCMITASADGKSAAISVTVKKKGPNFKALYEGIESSVKYGWELGSDNSYLSADTNVYDLDDYTNSNIWYSIKEMNTKIGLPASLANDMANTTWSMGKQKEIFEDVGVEVSWTYHPDKGMEVTYKLINN